jgi:hypothetical protein
MATQQKPKNYCVAESLVRTENQQRYSGQGRRFAHRASLVVRAPFQMTTGRRKG